MSPHLDGVWAVGRTPADEHSRAFWLKIPSSVFTYHIQCSTSPLQLLKLSEKHIEYNTKVKNTQSHFWLI